MSAINARKKIQRRVAKGQKSKEKIAATTFYRIAQIITKRKFGSIVFYVASWAIKSDVSYWQELSFGRLKLPAKRVSSRQINFYPGC